MILSLPQMHLSTMAPEFCGNACGEKVPRKNVSAWPCPFSDIIEHNGSYSL